MSLSQSIPRAIWKYWGYYKSEQNWFYCISGNLDYIKYIFSLVVNITYKFNFLKIFYIIDESTNEACWQLWGGKLQEMRIMVKSNGDGKFYTFIHPNYCFESIISYFFYVSFTYKQI